MHRRRSWKSCVVSARRSRFAPTMFGGAQSKPARSTIKKAPTSTRCGIPPPSPAMPRLASKFSNSGPMWRQSSFPSAAAALRPDVKIIACELASAQPLRSAFKAGVPTPTAHDAGFVSGVGYGSVLPEMWPLLRTMIDEVLTVPLAQVAQTIKLLAENNRIVAEGAGALSFAAALAAQYSQSKVCAVISGGNIDSNVFATILRGEMPFLTPPAGLAAPS